MPPRNLFSAPLEYRIAKYKEESKILESDIERDYLLNQQTLLDERFFITQYETFEKVKEIQKEYKKSHLRLTGEEQMYLEYPELKPKPKPKPLAIEGLKQFLLGAPSSTSSSPSKYLSPSVIAALEGESKDAQSPSLTPTRKTPITRLTGELDQASLAANLALIDKSSDIYKEFRELPRNKRNKYPIAADMRAFAEAKGYSISPNITSSNAVAEEILNQMPKKVPVGEPSANGLLRINLMKKKYRKR